MVLRLYFQSVLSPPSLSCNSITPDCRGEVTSYPPALLGVFPLPRALMAVVLIGADNGCPSDQPGTF